MSAFQLLPDEPPSRSEHRDGRKAEGEEEKWKEEGESGRDELRWRKMEGRGIGRGRGRSDRRWEKRKRSIRLSVGNALFFQIPKIRN